MYKLITPPAVTPISVANAKGYLRVTSNTNDALIESILRGATLQAQEYSGVQIINALWEVQFSDWPEDLVYTLGKGQVSAITSVVYNDVNGADQTWADTNYKLDNYSKPNRLLIVTDTLPTLNSKYPYVRVRYTAGFGATEADVPDDIKDALRLMVNQMYDVRTDERQELHKASERILYAYRQKYSYGF